MYDVIIIKIILESSQAQSAESVLFHETTSLQLNTDYIYSISLSIGHFTTYKSIATPSCDRGTYIYSH